MANWECATRFPQGGIKGLGDFDFVSDPKVGEFVTLPGQLPEEIWEVMYVINHGNAARTAGTLFLENRGLHLEWRREHLDALPPPNSLPEQDEGGAEVIQFNP